MVPLGVKCSFFNGMFVFGRKFLGRVVPLGVNFSFVSGMFVFRYKFLTWVVSLTLGRVLKTQKHPRFSYGTFPVCMIACTYVCHKGRVLKTQIYLNFFSFMWFFTLLVGSAPITFFSTPPCLHVCVYCVCVESKFIKLQNVVSSGF